MTLSTSDMQRIYTLSRKLYITRDVIDTFMDKTTDEQQSAYLSLLDNEFAHRHDARKARLLRKAKLPCMKSFINFDYTNLDFPDDYTKEDLESLSFIEAAEGFVFLGQTGRGKTHVFRQVKLSNKLQKTEPPCRT